MKDVFSIGRKVRIESTSLSPVWCVGKTGRIVGFFGDLERKALILQVLFSDGIAGEFYSNEVSSV